MSETILRVRDLVTTFPIGETRVPIVDAVSFEIRSGEVLSLVGESGCGKSMTALSVMRLVPKPGRVSSGTIELCGHDVLSRSVVEMRKLRGSAAAMIFAEGTLARRGRTRPSISSMLSFRFIRSSTVMPICARFLPLELPPMKPETCPAWAK